MSISPKEFDLLRRFIEAQCGILVSPDKSYLVESRLAGLLAETGCPDFESFYESARADGTGVLRARIVDAMVTNETMWFREPKFWALLRDVILPPFVAQLRKGTRRSVRIWSSACSTGQEPYSLAILIDELLRGSAGSAVPASAFQILGTDISATALRVAVSGRYNRIAMSRGMSDARKDRYFTDQKGVRLLDPAIRNGVTFKQLNLQHSFTPLGLFDIVLLRNVVIYFSETLRRDLFARVAAALTQGGRLFLGGAESLVGYKTRFTMREHNKTIYYQLGERGGQP